MTLKHSGEEAASNHRPQQQHVTFQMDCPVAATSSLLGRRSKHPLSLPRMVHANSLEDSESPPSSATALPAAAPQAHSNKKPKRKANVVKKGQKKPAGGHSSHHNKQGKSTSNTPHHSPPPSASKSHESPLTFKGLKPALVRINSSPAMPTHKDEAVTCPLRPVKTVRIDEAVQVRRIEKRPQKAKGNGHSKDQLGHHSPGDKKSDEPHKVNKKSIAHKDTKKSKKVKKKDAKSASPYEVESDNSDQRLRRLKRTGSFDSSLDGKTTRQKKFESFFPRRRELLEEMEGDNQPQSGHEPAEDENHSSEDSDKDSDDSKDFSDLSRDEQLKRLQKKAEKKKEKSSRDWVGLKSLTGANASGWKFQDSYYGNFNVGRRPSMDTAWGRRVYDQYEIELAVDKPKNKYLGVEFDPVLANFTRHRDPSELGLWDLIFNVEIIPKLEGALRWDPLHEDKMKEIRKLKIDVSKIDDDPYISDDTDPLNQFKLKFMQTGEYLRPHDMRYCIEKTNFTEDQIIDWFKRFKNDCPDGRLTRDHLRALFRQAFPDGNSDKFSIHIMRIFDSDGNGFLDFKEFLMAIDIATCDTEESKLKWAFKLFDVDNSGSLEVEEMIAVMETLESIDGRSVSFHRVTYDDSGNPEPVPTPAERAKDLFEALDKDGDGLLTMDEFVQGYMYRNELLARQDAMEQRRKLDCLLLKGHLIPTFETDTKDGDPEVVAVDPDRVKTSVANLLFKRAGVDLAKEDMDNVVIKEATEEYPRSAFVRFRTRELRMSVWSTRHFAKKNGLVMEEWLTVTRKKIYNKCKDLKQQGYIKDVYTRNGDIYAVVDRRLQRRCSDDAANAPAAATASAAADEALEEGDSPDPYDKVLTVTDTQYENLLRRTKGVDGDDKDGRSDT